MPVDKESTKIQIEIWSDIVCPWCTIGREKLETALSSFEHRDQVDIKWRSFELFPDAPRLIEGDRETYHATYKGIRREDYVEIQNRAVDLAAQVGLEFHMEKAREGNTFDAHRLLHLAVEYGLQDALKKRFFLGFFSEGAAIGDVADLERLAIEVGLPPEEVLDVLRTDRYTQEVLADKQTAVTLGVQGVPFMAFNRTYGISGAHSPEVLLEMLNRVWNESKQTLETVVEGTSCGVDGC
ncbi:DsbA family oxidoreductase [Paenibacillus sp. NPDC057934]|uniref:DsbA family oxidoreductase n=1 Tax=Paenibacillus sp. NPDC057934 TaxID=3346282 RepID=UPI0036D9E144